MGQQETTPPSLDGHKEASIDNDPDESVNDWENDYYTPNDTINIAISKRRYGPFNDAYDADYREKVDFGYLHRPYTSSRSESDEDCQHRPDEFGILRDTAGRVRAPNERLLLVSEIDIADIIAMTH
ncbi:Uncharacterized protein Rs2_21547 [Raphanus sativus]|nr:Uncharacterized protein Rs2_21547 [Raphanus sativus]